MSQHPSDQAQSWMTPPAQPAEMPPRATTWPMAIGIIMIVLGALGALLYACGGGAASVRVA